MRKLVKKIFYGGCWIISKMPAWMQDGIAHGIGILWYDVIRIRRKTVQQNIRFCFPNWSEEKVLKTARLTFYNQGRTIVDFAIMMTMDPKDMVKHCSFENKHILEKTVEDHGGAMLLGLHLSNGDFGIAALSTVQPNVYLVAKHFTSLWLDELLYETRHRFGTKTVEPRSSSFEILKALKRKGSVIFVLDQFMGPPLGVPTTFFGHPTGTAVGMALFAEKTRVPVIPVYTYRKPDKSYCVVFEEPIPFESTGNKEKDLQVMTQKYTDKIETIVRKYPEQWMWLHRRWKKFVVA